MMREDNTCGKSVANGVQFVDESAIEIDIADDDAVCGEKEKRVDCANILVSLSHKRGDESVDNEYAKQVGSQFEAAVENELILSSHDIMSQAVPQTKACANLSFHQPGRRRRKGKLKKKQNNSSTIKAAFVDETAVEIDIAHDDSSDRIVVITDDSDDDDMASRRSLHILSLTEDTSGNQNDVVPALQEHIISKQDPHLTTSRRSPDVAAVSLNKNSHVVSLSPTASRSQRDTTSDLCDDDLLLEYNLQRLRTISSHDSAKFPEIFFDEFDVEHLRKPFSYGWRRELVCRRTGLTSKDRLCDVYYMSPEGKKLRSKVEMAAYLLSATNSPVNLTHFTYKKVLLFSPPFETVRLAGWKRSRKLVGQSNSPEKKIQSQDCSSEGHVSTEKMPILNQLVAQDVGTLGP